MCSNMETNFKSEISYIHLAKLQSKNFFQSVFSHEKKTKEEAILGGKSKKCAMPRI